MTTDQLIIHGCQRIFNFQRNRQSKNICYRLTPSAFFALVADNNWDHLIWDENGNSFTKATILASLSCSALAEVREHVLYLKFYVEAHDVSEEAEVSPKITAAEEESEEYLTRKISVI